MVASYMVMQSITFRLSQKDIDYLGRLVKEDYAVNKSEALRRMIRERQPIMSPIITESWEIPPRERMRFRTRFDDDRIDRLIEIGAARVSEKKGLQILDEDSLKKMLRGEVPEHKLWCLYSFYECPFHRSTLDQVVERMT